MITMKNGYVMIQDVIPEERKTESGIILPKEKYNRIAKIISVCEGSKFKEGDLIIKPIGRSTPVRIDGVDYECIKEDIIFAKL